MNIKINKKLHVGMMFTILILVLIGSTYFLVFADNAIFNNTVKDSVYGNNINTTKLTENNINTIPQDTTKSEALTENESSIEEGVVVDKDGQSKITLISGNQGKSQKNISAKDIDDLVKQGFDLDEIIKADKISNKYNVKIAEVLQMKKEKEEMIEKQQANNNISNEDASKQQKIKVNMKDVEKEILDKRINDALERLKTNNKEKYDKVHKENLSKEDELVILARADIQKIDNIELVIQKYKEEKNKNTVTNDKNKEGGK